MKRSSLIPDEYVGDTHLTNWFRKNLGMADLHLIFIDTESFLRDELYRSMVTLHNATMLLQFKGGKVVKLTGQNITITKE